MTITTDAEKELREEILKFIQEKGVALVPHSGKLYFENRKDGEQEIYCSIEEFFEVDSFK